MERSAVARESFGEIGGDDPALFGRGRRARRIQARGIDDSTRTISSEPES